MMMVFFAGERRTELRKARCLAFLGCYFVMMLEMGKVI